MDLSCTGLLESVSVPDIITPEQYFDMRRSRAAFVAGENRLQLAVLRDAIRILPKGVGTKAKQQRLFLETLDWVNDREGTGPFAFEVICDAHDINPDWPRKELAVWLARQVAGDVTKLSRRSSANSRTKVNEARPHQRMKQIV